MTTAQNARPVRKDAARNRQALLNSADLLYRQRGYDCTLDEIARHAGVGVATAYRHFESKQALMAALFSDRLGRAEEVVRRALELSDPREALETFLYEIGESQATDRGLRESLGGDQGLDNAREIRKRFAPLSRQMFERAADAGLLRPEARNLDVPLIFWIVGAVSEYAGPEAPLLWRRYLDLLIDGLLAEGVARRTIEVPALEDDQLDAIVVRTGQKPVRM